MRLVLLLLALPSLAKCREYGLQSGPDNNEASLAGGMVLDVNTNVVYITGSTSGTFFGSPEDSEGNCFVAAVELPEHDGTTTTDHELTFQSRQQMGISGIPESCSAIGLLNSNRLFLGGTAREGGLMTTLRPTGQPKSTEYGIVMDMNMNGMDASLMGGRLMYVNRVHYPIAIASSPTKDSIFVASVVSDDTSPNQFYSPTDIHSYPYGKRYAMHIEKLNTTETFATSAGLKRTLNQVWKLPVGISQNSIYVAGVIYGGNDLVYVAGTVEGSNDVIREKTYSDDEDGFILAINASTGKPTDQFLRIEGKANRTDRVLGMCQQQGQEDEFYVVGSTNGVLDLQSPDQEDNYSMEAFIMKIQASNLNVIWTKQLSAVQGPLSMSIGVNDIQGIDCAVSNDGAIVYMVGRVEKGAIVNAAGHKSNGGDDVFVVQYRGQDGSETYVRQIGTSANDYATSVVTDNNGNAIIYGTTTGSLMRHREVGSTSSDVFLFSVSRDAGESLVPAEQSLPTNPTTSTNAPTATPVTTTPVTTSDDSPGKSGHTAVFGLLLVGGICITLVGCYVWKERRQAKDRYPENDHVLEYLKGFDDVEVDLKHSATGGWHGTYTNAPIHHRSGYTAAVNVDMMHHTTVVQDSLFMDDYDVPSLGRGDDDYDEREGLTRRASNYDGLVDAYNNTWEDLSPHIMPGRSSTLSTASTGSRRNTSRTTSSSSTTTGLLLDSGDFDDEDDMGSWGKEII